MVSYKKCFYALSLMFTLFNIPCIKSADLGELQVRKYISHLLDSLFFPQNHPSSHQQHLHAFSQELTNNVTRDLGVYPHFYSFSKTYNDEQVYQEVINESLMFIEKNARNCAINAVQSYYTETTGNQKIFVDKIINFLMKDLKTKLNKSAHLSDGIFTSYFGNILNTKINFLIDKELKKEAQKENARLEKLNALKCSICSLHYNTSANKKITLPCKHALCLSCLKVLWNKMHTAIACTKCNAKINMSEHVPGVWVTPSTTDSDYYYDTYYASPEPYINYVEGY